MTDWELVAGSAIEAQGQTEPEPRLGWDPLVEAVPLARGWDVQPCLVDWNGTGRLDLLVMSAGGEARRSAWLYRPVASSLPGSPPCYDMGTRIPALDGLRCVCPIVHQRPNRFDLVAMGPEGLVHLPNEGTAETPAFDRRIPLGPGLALGVANGRVVQMAAVDWDQDGLVDLLVGIHDLAGYWPDAERLAPTQQVGLNQGAGHPCYDRDGLWRGRAPVGRIFWLRNTGKDGEPRFELQPEIMGESGPLDLGLHPAPLTVSWGGRGSQELLVTDHRGLLRVYRNFGGQLPPMLMEARTLQCGGAPARIPDDRTAITAGDLDGDQIVELVYGTSSGRLFSVHAGPSRNETRNPALILQQPGDLVLAGHPALVACDLDADGDLDLVYGDAQGRLHYLEDRGRDDDHRYALPVDIEAGGAPFRFDPGPDGMLFGPEGLSLGFARPAVADWLDHGRPDLIVAGAGGDVLILPNDGGNTEPRFGHPVVMRVEGVPLILPPRVQPAVAAWSNPDDLDLIALDMQGFLCRYPRTGRGEVGRPIPLVDYLGRLIRLDGSFGLSGRCSLWAGPWTSPGKVDLLVGLTRGNRHVIPAATGCPLEDTDSLPTVLLLENLGHDVVAPRPLSRRDGRPVVAGHDGCSAQGVPRRTRDLPDLLLCGDDGRLEWIHREDLQW